MFPLAAFETELITGLVPMIGAVTPAWLEMPPTFRTTGRSPEGKSAGTVIFTVYDPTKPGAKPENVTVLASPPIVAVTLPVVTAGGLGASAPVARAGEVGPIPKPLSDPRSGWRLRAGGFQAIGVYANRRSPHGRSEPLAECLCGALDRIRRYYHRTRPHLGLGKQCPIDRQIMGRGSIVEISELGGLQHRYERVAA